MFSCRWKGGGHENLIADAVATERFGASCGGRLTLLSGTVMRSGWNGGRRGVFLAARVVGGFSWGRASSALMGIEIRSFIVLVRESVSS